MNHVSGALPLTLPPGPHTVSGPAGSSASTTRPFPYCTLASRPRSPVSVFTLAALAPSAAHTHRVSPLQRRPPSSDSQTSRLATASQVCNFWGLNLQYVF